MINLTANLSFLLCFGIKKISDFRIRKDNAVEKRVGLHCHTKMSDMDGVSEGSKILGKEHMTGGIRQLRLQIMVWYRRSRDANHYIETLDKDDPFKVIYGVEGYLVDDLQDVASQ